MEWIKRPRVENCIYADFIECPRCGLEIACDNEDAEDDECFEINCPIFKNGRWKE